MAKCDGHCGHPADGHEHLSMPDPEGTTRLAIIADRLRRMNEPTKVFGQPPQALLDEVDHIELVHERELAPGTTGIAAMHRQMHAARDDWGHSHRPDGSVTWDDEQY